MSIDLRHGEALAVLRELPTASVDAVITDPPYSSGGQYRSDRQGDPVAKYMRDGYSGSQLATFGGDNRDQRAYLAWCSLWMSECLRVTRPGGVLAVFADWRQLPVTTDAVQAGGWVWRGIVPWHKPNHRRAQGRFSAACEYVAWATAGARPVDYPAKSLAGHFSVSAPRDREHPTEKPAALLDHLVQIAPAGGTVLDPFMGSGSTGVAAVSSGRSFIGVELTEHYYAVAARRLRDQALDLNVRDVVGHTESVA